MAEIDFRLNQDNQSVETVILGEGVDFIRIPVRVIRERIEQELCLLDISSWVGGGNVDIVIDPNSMNARVLMLSDGYEVLDESLPDSSTTITVDLEEKQ
jgi:hypothetical protein